MGSCEQLNLVVLDEDSDDGYSVYKVVGCWCVLDQDGETLVGRAVLGQDMGAASGQVVVVGEVVVGLEVAGSVVGAVA